MLPTQITTVSTARGDGLRWQQDREVVVSVVRSARTQDEGGPVRRTTLRSALERCASASQSLHTSAK